MAWLSGWSRRKKVTVTGTTAGAQTDFQLMLDVTYDSDMLANFDDLRFTLADGTTLIDFWLESKVDSTSAVVWVEVPSIPANPDTVDIYMYYGKADAASASNGVNTFDIFNGGTLTGTNNTGASIIDGRIHIAAGASNYVALTQAISRPAILEFDLRSDGYQIFGLRETAAAYVGNTNQIMFHLSSTGNKHYNAYSNPSGTTWNEQSFTWDTARSKYKLIWNTAYDTTKFYINDVLYTTPAATYYSALTEMYAFFGAANSAAVLMDVDNIRVRKYASPEPTYGTGSEENAGYWFRLQARNELQGMRGING